MLNAADLIAILKQQRTQTQSSAAARMAVLSSSGTGQTQGAGADALPAPSFSPAAPPQHPQQTNPATASTFGLNGAHAPNAEPKTSQTPPSPAPAIDLPPGLIVKPWAHQIRGYAACMRAIRTFGACLLAAEMGVGKTLIATMLSLGVGSRRTLVVCPLRVIGSWRVQLAQYLGDDFLLTQLDDKKSVAKRMEVLRNDLQLAETTGRRHYVVINYDSYWREPIDDFLVRLQWGAIIYDESHKIKSPGGHASRMAARLLRSSKARILATGTPMAHSPLDAYGQFRAAAPQVLGTSFAAFRQRYAIWAGPNKRIRVGFQNIDELEAKIAPLTWRATKEEVLPDLPEQMDIEYETELSPQAATIYRGMEKAMTAEIAGGTITAANVLTKLLRLQQITGGAVPDDDGRYHHVCDSKQKLLADVIEDLGDRPFVVFCRFRSDIDAAHAACKAAGVEARELSGRFNQLEDWQAGGGQAIIVQMQSGSVGITLVRASVAIYYSLSTSLAEWDQSQARIHRPGQKNACTFVYLTVKGTVDQKILKALRGRQEVIEAIMTSVQQRSTAV